MPSANEALQDAAVRYAVLLERVKGEEARKLIAVFREVEGDLVAQLARTDPTAVKGRYTRARLQTLLRETQKILSAFYGELGETFRSTFSELGELDVDFQLGAISAASPVVLDYVRPAAATIHAAIFTEPMEGNLLSEWFEGMERVAQDRIRAAIRIGVIEGETISQIATRIRTATQRSRRGAEMIARTAVSHVSQVARQKTFEENADILMGEKWLATLDHRTCPVCGARDGEVYAVGKGPRYPAHHQCRCTKSPVLKSWRELGIDIDDAPEGTRASMDGPVPASLTYEEWLKGQPADVQDEVLGKAKGKLFRDGGLKLDKFAMADGSEMTLAELRQAYPKAFGRAGFAAVPGGTSVPPPPYPDDDDMRTLFMRKVEDRVRDKTSRYFFDTTHPDGGPKASWLANSLGFSPENIEDIVRQIRYDPAMATYSRTSDWGDRFIQIIDLEGLNGRVMSAKFVWQIEDGIPMLITMTPAKKRDRR